MPIFNASKVGWQMRLFALLVEGYHSKPKRCGTPLGYSIHITSKESRRGFQLRFLSEWGGIRNFALEERGGIPVTEIHHLREEGAIVHVNGPNHEIALAWMHPPYLNGPVLRA